MSKVAQSRIPVLDLVPEIEAQWDELIGAIESVLRSGRFILGPNVEAFEREFASYLGVGHAVGVNSGTDALVIALRALGIGAGDEVITPSFTFFATPESISNVDAVPVFVDIDPSSYTIDPDLLEAAITERTKAIVPVHLYGAACDMDPIMRIAERHGIAVVEDVAQAAGGRYRGTKLGALGHASAFSFFPSKNLAAFGDAGMVVTNDDAVAEEARKLRAHGSIKKYANEMLGYNSRLDELQAAILRVRMRRLDDTNEARRRIARWYTDGLSAIDGVDAPSEAADTEHVFHQYTVRIIDRDRDEVRSHLAEQGIDTMVYYPVPCHRLPTYAGSAPGGLPVTDEAARTVLSLPMSPSLDEATVGRIVGAFR